MNAIAITIELPELSQQFEQKTVISNISDVFINIAMTRSFLIKGSTILHAIAFTVALALVSSNYNGHKGHSTHQMTNPVLQVQLASENMAIAPELTSSHK